MHRQKVNYLIMSSISVVVISVLSILAYNHLSFDDKRYPASEKDISSILNTCHEGVINRLASSDLINRCYIRVITGHILDIEERLKSLEEKDR